MFKINIYFFISKLDNNLSYIKILNEISKPSNIINEITIVEGWQIYQLKKYLKKYFNKSNIINYENIIADTYHIKSGNNIENLFQKMNKYKIDFFEKYK